MVFREELAGLFGIDLNKMQGYCDGNGISWNTIKDDIAIILNHSDCDGEIKFEDLVLLLPRLKYAEKISNKVIYNLHELIMFIEEIIEQDEDESLIFT
jgi:hypothetical protein